MRRITTAALVAATILVLQSCDNRKSDLQPVVAQADYILSEASFSSKNLYVSKVPKMKFAKAHKMADEDSIAKQTISEQWKNDCIIPSSVNHFAFY